MQAYRTIKRRSGWRGSEGRSGGLATEAAASTSHPGTQSPALLFSQHQPCPPHTTLPGATPTLRAAGFTHQGPEVHSLQMATELCGFGMEAKHTTSHG